ncbi:acyltransferase ChoActase/COT/CPT [Fomitiporia mediterranea MF3/22]|uniref:acyltransferase ChoActase/COT/CPT n=1 Tax=Fomitiporia mediterranea (strain MF3/22) TaxID=694068 RepID=UPI0004408785|nr:acyltransferase ChoActase/COT/CPT [Fomitiporia mediterranea MF3/22]EJD00440.1 acyltransferase ChoActase/COT/CPT [Fomitiporia mediterranea MF3/22]
MAMVTTMTKFDEWPEPKPNRTFASQSKLPRLPIPPLEDTCKRYLRALKALQSPQEHADTERAVRAFLEDPTMGPRMQKRLEDWAKDKNSYIEDFWYESYLSHTDPVVLALNPFFVLEDDPTPSRGSQVPRAAALITSALGFIHDLRAGLLEPDNVRGVPLDMDQYTRLFGTARIPTQRGCRMLVNEESSHIVVLRRGQFYWFDVLDGENRPLLTEREILRNLQAIVDDADRTHVTDVAKSAIGVCSTENRKIWSGLRELIQGQKQNAGCLEVVDGALFVVCLDDASPADLAQLCDNFLCGTYDLRNGVQVGTCTNRWYDKLQIIVCADGSAGINFEHTGVDGHTVLRFAADIFTDGLMLLARSINPSAPTLFHAPLSPYAKSYKPPKGQQAQPPKGQQSQPPKTPNGINGPQISPRSQMLSLFNIAPKKLEWVLSPQLRAGIRFAETRLSDLICQNDCQALEFKGYGKVFITSHGFSPDAFVQMAFQAAYFGLYGRTECTYEPAMTKQFFHGRTEAIRTVQPESVEFTKTFFSDAPQNEKITSLRKACERHVALTKECSKGLGQDRHMYALYCLFQREIADGKFDILPDDPVPSPTWPRRALPEVFTDPGWSLLSTSIISTSNCGNPALRLFGFGPVAADGYGIGYIIKDDGISICASSKHLQTRRFLDTLESYLRDVQRILVHLHRAANAPPTPFIDITGILRDARTGRPIHGQPIEDENNEYDEYEVDEGTTGYSFFDSGEIKLLGRADRERRSLRSHVGKVIPMAEY